MMKIQIVFKSCINFPTNLIFVIRSQPFFGLCGRPEIIIYSETYLLIAILFGNKRIFTSAILPVRSTKKLRSHYNRNHLRRDGTNLILMEQQDLTQELQELADQSGITMEKLLCLCQKHWHRL